jgi:hypothetical protein
MLARSVEEAFERVGLEFDGASRKTASDSLDDTADAVLLESGVLPQHLRATLRSIAFVEVVLPCARALLERAALDRRFTEVTPLRRTLDSLGLVMPSAHVDLETLEQRLDRAVEFWGELGCRTLVCPWVNEETRAGDGAWVRLADRLDRIGERLQARGLRFACHNHDFELASGEDRLAAMLDRCAVDHLGLELDAFWVAHAGLDPAALSPGQRGRVRLVHLRTAGTAVGLHVGKGESPRSVPRPRGSGSHVPSRTTARRPFGPAAPQRATLRRACCVKLAPVSA